MTTPTKRYAVTMIWVNGVKTVNQFDDEAKAKEYVRLMLDLYRHNLIYYGELVEQPEEDSDTEEK